MNKTVIDSGKKELLIPVKELLKYKDLFLTLAYRDLRVRYAQTFLGLFWAILQPLSTLVIFTVVFGHVAKIDTGDIPYPLFVLCGMSCWTYFSFVLNQSSLSIKNAGDMIKKIYFPRLILPLSKAVVGLVDYLIVIVMLVIALIYSGVELSSNMLYFPFFVFVTIVSSLTIGIWLSALTVRFRDFQHVIPFLVQFGLYASPIAYPASAIVNKAGVPEWLKVAYFLNPMAGATEGMRWCLLDTDPPNYLTYVSFAFVLILFFFGLRYFSKIEKTAADLI